MCRCHHRGLLIGRGSRDLPLPLRDGAGLRQPRVGLLVEERELVRGLLLRKLRFGSCQVGIRLAHSPGSVHLGLLGAQLGLHQTLL